MIAVVGSGSWGTAIAALLANKGERVTLWSYFLEESRALARDLENREFLPGVALDKVEYFTNNLEEAVKGADLIVVAVPSHTMRKTLQSMRAWIPAGQKIVSISKGLEPKSLKRMSEIYAEELPYAKFSVLSGPSHAEEVGLNMPTTCVVASEDSDLAEDVQKVFMTPTFRVYTSTDVTGVELGGALKNVIALCAGVVDGLGYGDNTKAALMTRGLAEMTRLGVAMGAKSETFSGLSGIGDLIVTCTSMHSRNRRFGIMVGKGVPIPDALEEIHMVVEGINACEAAYALAERFHVEMPIVDKAYQVLFQEKDPRDTVMQLMGRDRRGESEIHMLRQE